MLSISREKEVTGLFDEQTILSLKQRQVSGVLNIVATRMNRPHISEALGRSGVEPLATPRRLFPLASLLFRHDPSDSPAARFESNPRGGFQTWESDLVVDVGSGLNKKLYVFYPNLAIVSSHVFVSGRDTSPRAITLGMNSLARVWIHSNWGRFQHVPPLLPLSLFSNLVAVVDLVRICSLL